MRHFSITLFALLFVLFASACSSPAEQAALVPNSNENSLVASDSNNPLIDVRLDVTPSINQEGKVSFLVETNLPDSTIIMFTLSQGGYSAQDKGVVRNGTINTSHFSKQGVPLSAGDYILNISTPIASSQSKEVQQLIGEKGTYLTGNLTKESEYFAGMVVVDAVYSITISDNGSISCNFGDSNAILCYDDDNIQIIQEWRDLYAKLANHLADYQAVAEPCISAKDSYTWNGFIGQWNRDKDTLKEAYTQLQERTDFSQLNENYFWVDNCYKQCFAEMDTFWYLATELIENRSTDREETLRSHNLFVKYAQDALDEANEYLIEDGF